MGVNQKSIKILQLTDTHLLKDNSLLFNVNTNLAYKKVMDKIQKELNDTYAVFLTGDLSQDESYESYQVIVEAFKNFDRQIFWIPGNHDSVQTMEAVFSKSKNFFRTTRFSTPTWDFIFLNTKQEGIGAGLLSTEELAVLEYELKIASPRSIALVMHHHPVKVGTPLIDNYILQESERFLEMVKYYKVELIICGHVHGDYSMVYDTIRIETAPASCFQIKKNAIALDIDESIGYKVYYFSSNQYVAQAKLWKY